MAPVQKRTITSPIGPSGLGPYSPALQVGNTLYISGQIGVDPRTNEVVRESFEAQALQAFRNLRALLAAAGGSHRDVVKVCVFLTDISKFAELNAIYKKQFEAPYPARTTLGVKELPLGVEIEIDAIAELSDRLTR